MLLSVLVFPICSITSTVGFVILVQTGLVVIRRGSITFMPITIKLQLHLILPITVTITITSNYSYVNYNLPMSAVHPIDCLGVSASASRLVPLAPNPGVNTAF